MYDFNRCKLCGERASSRYKLKKMSLYVCDQCDFHYIDALDELPAPVAEDSPLTVSARKFINNHLPQNAVLHKKNLAFVHHCRPLGDARCLDIGCGAGQFLSLVGEDASERAGIEPQQVFRDFAREKYGLEFRSELVDDPYWQKNYSGYFDVVTLWDTLEHVNFPAETLAAAAALMKPGGWLFLDTPSRDTFFYRASQWSYRLSGGTKPALLNRLYSAGPFRHKQIFTRSQLLNLLARCGLQHVTDSHLHRSKNKLVVACQKR
ncbi:MAG: hypothetical protein C0618_10850 [Desulfuromonas sp.]|nr:MAG: hypothetical protein C0618_10850 [Desulfuromonas sp.]